MTTGPCTYKGSCGGLNETSPVHQTNGNTVTLREYIESIFAGHQETHRGDAREAARDRAELERRLAELNQLRDEVLTDRSRFITREIASADHKQLQVQIDDLKRS